MIDASKIEGIYVPSLYDVEYNEDGTLKSNARVVYVTDENKDTVSLDIAIDNSGAQPIVGIQNILTALKKGYEKN